MKHHSLSPSCNDIRNARRILEVTYTAKELDARPPQSLPPLAQAALARARQVLEVVHSPEVLATMPPQRLLLDAEAFEDSYARARLGW